MTRALAVVIAMVVGSSGLLANREDLSRARQLFNERRFDEAIEAATAARKTPDTADAAAIVLARAHLERYRQLADPTDLGAARSALSGVSVDRLGTPDRAEFLIALGGSLFLEDDFGAAAEVFESAMEIAPAAGDDAREAVLDWYGRGHGAPGRALRDLAAGPDVDPPGRPHGARAGQEPGLAGGGLLAGRGRCAARATPIAPGRPPSPAWVRAPLAGDARGCRCGPTSTGSCWRASSPTAAAKPPRANAKTAKSQLRADWELVKERWK